MQDCPIYAGMIESMDTAVGMVLDKLDEEVREMHAALQSGNVEEMEDELGDLLFVLTNLARKLDIDPAHALRRANAKFELRFRAIERSAGSRAELESMSLDELRALIYD